MPHGKLFTSLLTCLLIFSYFLTSSLSIAAVKFPPPERLKYPPLSFNPPQPEKIQLNNGLLVYFLRDSELPLINISALVRAGSIYDPRGKEGLADITGTVMRTGGTRTVPSGEVNRLLDFTGTMIEVTVGRESTSVSMTVLKEHLASAMNIFAGILRQPAFEEKQFDLAKSLRQAGLRRTLDDPDRLAFREFHRLIYRDNPRGRQSGINSLRAITRDDARNFHEQYFHPANIMIAVSGDLTRAEAIDNLEKHFGDWRTEKASVPDILPPLTSDGKPGGLYFIEKDTPQAVIIAGWIAPKKAVASYYPFLLGDFLLGSGGFRSRIFSEVRSTRGLAYSTGSIYRAKSEYGIFLIYAMTSNKNALTTVSLLKQIVNDFKNKPPAPKELLWASNSLNNAFIFSFVSAKQVVWNYLMLEFDGLPPDYYHTYRDKVAKVRPDDVFAIARQYLSWDEAVVLLLGKEKEFERPLSDLGEVKRHKVSIE